MEANIPWRKKIYNPIPNRRPLRAIVEIIKGKLSVLPVAESDGDEREIRDALRLAVEDWR